ncbi:hypothetical protein [Streptomyces sp. NPDC007020]|uniref:hypothetical protein n=1 Tax=Streptomyces sp. NPDC007020 TaxID=3154585 RepID=UPI0033F74061
MTTAALPRVTVVAAQHRDAVLLVAQQQDAAALGVLCARSDDKEGRAALDRALAEAESRGCRVVHAPRTLTGQSGTKEELLRQFLELRPQRLLLPDPDPVRVGYDRSAGVPLHDVPPEQAATALDALAAAREYQHSTGEPVFVDCRRAGADASADAATVVRYPCTTRWLTEGFDGRLSAFLPSAGGVLRWTQDEQGGRAWKGPELLAGPSLMPGLSVLRDQHGFVHLLALRRTPRKDGGEDVAVVKAAQYRAGGPLTPWHSLGSPNPGDRYKSREVGFPAAGFDASGTLFVFARNFGHSLSFRAQGADGRWAPWQHLRGARIADELVTVTTARGGVEVYARARDSTAVVRWHKSGAGGGWTEDRTALSAAPGSLSAGPEPGTLLFRDPHTNEPCVWQPGAVSAVPIGGADGVGPVTGALGVQAEGWTYSALVRSGPGGSCVVGAHVQGRPDAGVWWNDLGAHSSRMPAMVHDRMGTVTLATVDVRGRLSWTSRLSPNGPFEFGSWHTT